MNVTPNRRQLLQGAGLTTLWHLAGAPSVAFAATPAPGDVLVSIFLQGGFDGLSAFAPIDHPVYVAARGGTPVAVARPPRDAAGLSTRPVDQAYVDWRAERGGSAAVAAKHETTSDLPLGHVGDGDDRTPLFLHLEALPLKDLVARGDLAVVFNSGFAEGAYVDDGSHFQATDRLLCGEPDAVGGGDGWLGRALAGVDRRNGGTPVSDDVFRVMDLGAGLTVRAPVNPDTGLRYTQPIAATPAELVLRKAKVGTREFATLEAEYDGVSNDYAVTARTTFNAMRAAAALTTQATAEPYPSANIGAALKNVAALVKADRGIQAATISYGNWDDHGGLATVFPGRLRALAWALRAFAEDLRSTKRRVTVVVTSEFGRRVAANGNGGTDHGYGNVTLVLGAGGATLTGQAHGVRGGLYTATWRSLGSLARNGNLGVATDFRQVLGEVVAKRALGAYDLALAREVFPAYFAQRDPAAAFAGVLA